MELIIFVWVFFIFLTSPGIAYAGKIAYSSFATSTPEVILDSELPTDEVVGTSTPPVGDVGAEPPVITPPEIIPAPEPPPAPVVETPSDQP